MTSILNKTKNSLRSFSTELNNRKKNVKDKLEGTNEKLNNLKKVRVSKNEENKPVKHNNKLSIKLHSDVNSKIEKVSNKAIQLRSSYETLNCMLSKEKVKNNQANQIIDDFGNKLNIEQSRNLDILRDISETKNKVEKSAEKTISMLEFSNSIRRRWNDVSGTIKIFEDLIINLQYSNRKLSEEFEKKFYDLGNWCDYTENIMFSLHDNISNQIKSAKERENKIRELEIRKNLILEEILEEKNMFFEKEQVNEIQNKEMDSKIIHLTKNFFDLSTYYEDKQTNMRNKIKTSHSREINKEYLELKINDLMRKNDLLRKEVENLTTKLNKPKAPISLMRNKSVSYY